MKKNILLMLLLMPIIALAQLQPTIGGKYTGGLSYDMEHEYFSAQVGLMKTFQDSKFADVSVSGEIIYDYMQEFSKKHNFYIVRLQASNAFSQKLSLTYYAGYINSFDNDLMKNFNGKLKSNLAVGGGVRFNSDNMYAEVMYENLAGYPHISIGVHFKLWKIKSHSPK